MSGSINSIETVRERLLEDDGFNPAPKSKTRSWRIRALGLVAVIGWTLLFGLLYHCSRTLHIHPTVFDYSSLAYSPVQDLLEYQLVPFNSGFDHEALRYMGYPKKEIDDNWNNLYQKIIDPTPEMAEHGFPITGTPENPGDDNPEWWSLYVFHQLHCLNLLRRSLYPDYYDPALDPLIQPPHLAHCVETLRKSLLCASDITPFAFRYIDSTAETSEWDKSTHVCRNFEKIHSYARDLPNVTIPSRVGRRAQS